METRQTGDRTPQGEPGERPGRRAHGAIGVDSRRTPAARDDAGRADDLTPADFERLFAWLPFDWRWLLAGWALGFAAGVLVVLWFLVFIVGPAV